MITQKERDLQNARLVRKLSHKPYQYSMIGSKQPLSRREGCPLSYQTPNLHQEVLATVITGLPLDVQLLCQPARAVVACSVLHGLAGSRVLRGPTQEPNNLLLGYVAVCTGRRVEDFVQI